jgi:tRNA threonylcarbamoyladenosine dehydratase
MDRLRKAKVALFGLGGVGSYALEALARAGVGHLHLVDSERVEPSNLNRQLLALESTLGVPKVEVARERVAQINPDAVVTTQQEYVTPDNPEDYLPQDVGYAVDAIDSVRSKIALLRALHGRGIPFVACMGAACKLAASGVQVADISETSHCRLAHKIRIQLRRAGIVRGVRCVYSEEAAVEQRGASAASSDRFVRGTISHVPGIVGLTAAGVIINDILDPNQG